MPGACRGPTLSHILHITKVVIYAPRWQFGQNCMHMCKNIARGTVELGHWVWNSDYFCTKNEYKFQFFHSLVTTSSTLCTLSTTISLTTNTNVRHQHAAPAPPCRYLWWPHRRQPFVVSDGLTDWPQGQLGPVKMTNIRHGQKAARKHTYQHPAAEFQG